MSEFDRTVTLRAITKDNLRAILPLQRRHIADRSSL
jgi:hypothetical protein